MGMVAVTGLGDALVALGGAFLVAGLLARLGKRVRLPTIPFFMAAGILVGPNTPGIVLFHDPADLEVFAAVGLILLLFHLGLEFSVERLLGGGAKLAGAGATYLVLNIGGAFLFGLALGWGTGEALILAGAMGISSSAIVTKLVVELGRVGNRETPMILGIIVVEDVFLALYLAALQPLLGGASGAAEAALEVGIAVGVLVVLFAIARYGSGVVARLVGARDDEVLTILFVGLAILVAGVSEELGVSAAIGALMVGLILGGTDLKARVERLVGPLRDAFGAVFFFAFGLTIDPADVGSVAVPVLLAVLLTLALNLLAGTAGARIYGFGPPEAANAGTTLLGRGEFSLILVSLAAAAGMDERLGPFVAEYVLVLAVLGPLLASRSAAVARIIPRRATRRSGSNRTRTGTT